MQISRPRQVLPRTTIYADTFRSTTVASTFTCFFCSDLAHPGEAAICLGCFVRKVIAFRPNLWQKHSARLQGAFVNGTIYT